MAAGRPEAGFRRMRRMPAPNQTANGGAARMPVLPVDRVRQGFAEEMTVRQYSLVTHWHLEAPIERVWEALVAAAEWPRWWRYVQAVVELDTGDAQGLGSLRRYTWSSRLPYRLTFDMRTTALTRPSIIEGVAAGDLNGVGRWQLHALGNSCRVRYDWTVTTGKSWMNLLSPVLAPVFAWNHDQVMLEGGRGLARHLGVALLAFEGSSDSRRKQGTMGASHDA